MAVLQQMVIFFIMMAVGLYARHKKIITEENQAQLSSLVVNIAYPAIILSGAVAGGPHIGGKELAEAAGAAIALLVLALLAAAILARVLGYKKGDNGIARVMVVFTNIGFMGVPMIAGIYGSGALIYMTVFLIPFNILFFSYAIKTIQGGSGLSSFSPRDLLNAGMISCFLAIIIYLSDIRLPYVITMAVQMVGSMTAPLAMMLMGASLEDIRLKELITDKKLIAFSLIKMILIPVGIVLILEQFFHNPLLMAVCMAALATPSGNVIPLLASIYNKESYPLSVKGVTLTTVISVVTMPAAFYLAGL